MSHSPRTMPAIGNDVMNIANRMRELAIQLEKDQKALKIAQQRLAKLKEIEQQEQDINAQKRRKLLQATNARNEVELEIFAVKDKVAAAQKAIEEHNQERTDLEARLVEAQDEAKHLIETVYAPQQVKMDVYMRAMEGIINSKRDKVQKRLDRLAAIRAEAKELKVKEKAERKEAKQVRKDIAALAEEQKSHSGEDISSIHACSQNLIKEVRYFIMQVVWISILHRSSILFFCLSSYPSSARRCETNSRRCRNSTTRRTKSTPNGKKSESIERLDECSGHELHHRNKQRIQIQTEVRKVLSGTVVAMVETCQYC